MTRALDNVDISALASQSELCSLTSDTNFYRYISSHRLTTPRSLRAIVVHYTNKRLQTKKYVSENRRKISLYNLGASNARYKLYKEVELLALLVHYTSDCRSQYINLIHHTQSLLGFPSCCHKITYRRSYILRPPNFS